jgi:hypothetical protein
MTALLAARISCALAACWAVSAAPVRADTLAAIHPALRPDSLGASTALTLALKLSGGQEGVPEPLSRVVVHLPAGLGIDLRGVPACATRRLQRRGARGCPASALIGRGHALLEAHAGSQTIPEEAVVTAYRGVEQGGRPTLAILGQGETPLEERIAFGAVQQPDGAPYGTRLEMSIPAIPTLPGEPNASTVSFSLTVGGGGRRPRAHHAAGAITVPHSCPAGGFPFAADFTFADGSSTSARAEVPCP